MDKNLKSFILASTAFLAGFLILFGIFIYVYLFSSPDIYSYILLLLMMITLIIILVLITAISAAFYAYKKQQAKGAFLKLLKTSLNIIKPIILFLPALLKKSGDSIKNFYIQLNNILVNSENKGYRPEDVLVLLPHCLQNSDCLYKVTGDLKNCCRCGKCCIGTIAVIVEKAGVKAAVATGGTLARSIIEKTRPGIILSVACERDLASGIADVSGIPVVGMVNSRPNGPCFNTLVDVEEFKKKLYEILNNEAKV